MPPAEADAALDWARSGAMALTGEEEGPPRLAPGPLASLAEVAVATLRVAAPKSARLRSLDGAALLGERAAILALRRRGRVSPSGSCQLLRTADGWIAANLPRDDDRSLLPAWLEWLERDGLESGDDPWPRVRRSVAAQSSARVLERARLLGLAVADAAPGPRSGPPACRTTQCGPRVARRPDAQPLVLDLSALWAGPLCTHLLQLAGARVVKLESTQRPDGARAGPAAFFDLLNAGKQSVAFDFTAREGRSLLRSLAARADVVVESARPRALAQLGVDAREIVAGNPGLTWVSITGYGRPSPGGGWVAFGDDAAAAAGLARATSGNGEAPLFCGDAIADPLTGLHAAVLALAAFRAGGGALLDVSLTGVVAEALSAGDARDGVRVVRSVGDGDAWRVEWGAGAVEVAPPRARPVRERARPLGADTSALLRELDLSC